MNNCRTCTNTILIRHPDSLINHKIDCKCLHKLTTEEQKTYFNEEREGCPHWAKSAFADDKLKQYV